MGKIDGQFVVILDLNRVLSVEEVAVIASVANSAAAASSV
jgi:hypothetical protein